MNWHVNILTLFPEMFPGPLKHSIAGKALSKKKWQLETINIRDFSEDKHHTVDDKPFGGGSGLVMRPDVLGRSIEHTLKKHPKTKLIYLTPRGKIFNQSKAKELANTPNITFICGRYEAIDERVILEYPIEELSIGDYILSGGEIAAMAVIDACLRLIFGVISKDRVFEEESFNSEGQFAGLLEYSQFTRPLKWKNHKVPEVLVSGNHKEIGLWRLSDAIERTKLRRPDLWEMHKKLKSGE